jgi:hypothetical protein
MFGSANQIFEKGMTEGAKIAARAGAAAGKATRWARGAYLAVGAGISYWFFRGGLIDATSGALGIPEWAASLIWAVAGLIIVAMVAYMALRWIRARARYVAGGGRRRRW